MATTSADQPVPVPKFPIIDSHIHLYPASEAHTLAWHDPSNALSAVQHSVDEFAAATSSPPELEGFVFLEADRECDVAAGEADGSGWDGPLMEVDWIRRIAVGEPEPGEGHDESQKGLVQGIVPWAPLPSGEEVMKRYIAKAREVAGEAAKKLSGFRYLLQDKPEGVMLQEKFIESLKLLGRERLTFDLGVDQRRGGDWQLEEAVEMIRLAHEGVEDGQKVTIVISTLVFLHLKCICMQGSVCGKTNLSQITCASPTSQFAPSHQTRSMRIPASSYGARPCSACRKPRIHT